jgi:hypothetical protein
MTDMRDETRPERGLVHEASTRAAEAGATAQEKAAELRAEGSEKLREQLDRRSTDAGTQARSLAEALRRSSADLRTEGKGGVADLADRAAQRIDDLGAYLEQKQGAEILRDVENFTRRRPWMIATLGLVGGLAASRFVKASSERRYPGPARGAAPRSDRHDTGAAAAGREAAR